MYVDAIAGHLKAKADAAAGVDRSDDIDWDDDEDASVSADALMRKLGA